MTRSTISDARHIPREAESIDVAVSNDVFVDILQIEDKAAVIGEAERLLKPGGVMVFNHSSSRAFGHSASCVDDHCSFLTLNDFIALVRDNSSFVIEDIKPSYYSILGRPRSVSLRHLLVALPFGAHILACLDNRIRRQQPVDLSDYVYLKVRKPGA
jgi:hypothetical protein